MYNILNLYTTSPLKHQ